MYFINFVRGTYEKNINNDLLVVHVHLSSHWTIEG